METWKRHICYCLIGIILTSIWILLTDSKAIEHLTGIAIVSLFGLFMALAAVSLSVKKS